MRALFFVLKQRKEPKENSRKKVMLRTFFHCWRTGYSTTGPIIHDE
jgi:hypothetical protein